MLAFSGAFLLGMTIFEMLPRIYNSPQNARQIGLFIVIGILLQICLEFFSKGAEHGHVHIDKNESRFPWVLFISLSIHSLIEGTPVHGHDHLLYGIVIHKIPVAIILSTFFLKSKLKLQSVLLFLVLFSLMTPIGTWLMEANIGLNKFTGQITAIAIGIFLHISTTILFESSEGHKFNLVKLSVILFGVILAYLI